jgi:Ribonuclease G/E
LAKTGENKQLEAKVHPEVGSYLFNQAREEISNIEQKNKVKIVIKADSERHLEDIDVSYT